MADYKKSSHTYFSNSVSSVLHVPVRAIGAEDCCNDLHEEREDEVGEVHELSEGGGVLEEDEAEPSKKDNRHETYY